MFGLCIMRLMLVCCSGCLVAVLVVCLRYVVLLAWLVAYCGVECVWWLLVACWLFDIHLLVGLLVWLVLRCCFAVWL